MKKYKPNKDGFFCGYWNESPCAIYFHQDRKKLYKNEMDHYHSDFFEYYHIYQVK